MRPPSYHVINIYSVLFVLFVLLPLPSLIPPPLTASAAVQRLREKLESRQEESAGSAGEGQPALR